MPLRGPEPGEPRKIVRFSEKNCISFIEFPNLFLRYCMMGDRIPAGAQQILPRKAFTKTCFQAFLLSYSFVSDFSGSAIFHKKTINTIYNHGSFYTDDYTGSEMN